jgi:pimeloyl-ACP methyl ester carboxylesterase
MDATPFVDRWWTSRDGLKLYARDYPGATGEARLPVICIHGLTRNSRDFGDVASYIAAAGRRVLAIDVRGRGRSAYDPKPMNYTPATYARDVIALFEAAGIARALFVGTSMGGLITMAMCAFRPKMVAGAVLNDVGPEVSPVGLARIASYVGKGGAIETWEDAAAYARTTNGVAFPHFTDADWMDFARRTFREENGKPVLDYDPNISVPIRAAGPKALTPKLWPFFRKLARGRPLLLVRGETSDILDAGVARRMKAMAPRMAYAEAPGVGHAPTLSEPTAREAILALLATAP